MDLIILYQRGNVYFKTRVAAYLPAAVSATMAFREVLNKVPYDRSSQRKLLTTRNKRTLVGGNKKCSK